MKRMAWMAVALACAASVGVAARDDRTIYRYRLRPEFQLDRNERHDGARLPALEYQDAQGF